MSFDQQSELWAKFKNCNMRPTRSWFLSSCVIEVYVEEEDSQQKTVKQPTWRTKVCTVRIFLQVHSWCVVVTQVSCSVWHIALVTATHVLFGYRNQVCFGPWVPAGFVVEQFPQIPIGASAWGHGDQWRLPILANVTLLSHSVPFKWPCMLHQSSHWGACSVMHKRKLAAHCAFFCSLHAKPRCSSLERTCTTGVHTQMTASWPVCYGICTHGPATIVCARFLTTHRKTFGCKNLKPHCAANEQRG